METHTLPSESLSGLTAENLKESATEKHNNEYRPTKVFIPDLLARWPWSRRINPHYAAVKQEFAAWIASLGAFSPKAQHAYDRCEFNLVGCLIYPRANEEHARAGCGLMNLYFVFDEYSDVSEPSEVRKQKNAIMNALRNPHKPRPQGEWVGGEIARQFWELAIRNASEGSRKRFIPAFNEYLEAVVEEAIDRSGHRIRDVKGYIEMRRQTVGVKPIVSLRELGLDIPDEVISHPVIKEMSLAITDMILIANDIASYNLEQTRGDDGHNLLTAIMNEFGTDENGAILWAQDLHAKSEHKFLAAMEALPKWEEPLNSQVKEYCDGLGELVRGNYEWQFESERYFGDRGLEIREKGWVHLLPKMRTRELGPILIDSSLL